MKIDRLHSWNVSPEQAAEIQKKLTERVILKKKFKSITLIAGCDLAYDLTKKKAYGGVIVYHWPDLSEVERKIVVKKIRFPYIPGLLSFREGPVLIDVISSLKHDPDIFIFDGQGIAHPRGIGIATHLGLFLNKPTIGCAKSRLCGFYREPGPKAGSHTPLLSNDQERIGAVVRTRDRVQPIFVSPGHKIDLRTSVKVILQCTDGYRIPKPTREADHFVEAIKRAE